MTTSNTSEPGDSTERESMSQANIELQAEKILKVNFEKFVDNSSELRIQRILKWNLDAHVVTYFYTKYTIW